MIWLLQRTVSPLYGRLHNAWTVLRSVAQRRDHRPPAWQDLVDANALIVSPLLGCDERRRLLLLIWPGVGWNAYLTHYRAARDIYEFGPKMTLQVGFGDFGATEKNARHELRI